MGGNALKKENPAWQYKRKKSLVKFEQRGLDGDLWGAKNNQ